MARSVTISYNKNNKDIQDLLNEKKEQGINVTDYVSDAIRFYEERKEEVTYNNLSLDTIKKVAALLGVLGPLIGTPNEVITTATPVVKNEEEENSIVIDYAELAEEEED